MPALPKTGQDIVNLFEQYTDDTSELSSTQELALANKIYRIILSDRPWLFLQKDSGDLTAQADTNGNYYVTLPTDFGYIPITSGDTNTGTYGEDKTIFTVDANGNFYPYKVINFTDRRIYKNMDGYCYVDLAAKKLYFTFPPVNTTVNFDYIYSPDDITLATSPVFPADFHDMIYHGMTLDDNMIQLFDHFRSYATENKAAYEGFMSRLASYNSQFYAQ